MSLIFGQVLGILDHSHKENMDLHTTSLDNLFAVASADSRDLKHIADKAQQDSRAMRIATVISMFYLPVSLTAAIFSTDLVRVSDENGVTVKKAFWVFVVLATVLMACTALGARLWSSGRTLRVAARNLRRIV